MLTERPIPGQSLRTPPKNAPYERPPETANPLEALNIHLDNLSEKGAMEDVINALELDVDLVTLVEAILRSAVMEGIHSIDISLMIAPHIHEFIKGELDAIGVEYDEGFLDTVGENRLKESRIGSRIVDSIDRKENEFQLVHSLFLHYLDKSDEYMTKLQYYHNLWLKSEFEYHEFIIKTMKGGFKHD